MGAWGVNVFENDSAMDWVIQLEEEKDVSQVFLKLVEIKLENRENNNVLLDSDLASEGLAAIEIEIWEDVYFKVSKL